MLIAIGSVKGAPGVTTLAVGLAARWPAPGAVLVEADPAGGDLAFRFGHHRHPGLTELAAETRGSGIGRDLAEHAQTLRLGARVVFGPAEQEAEAAIRLLAAPTGVARLRAAGITGAVLVDVGRLVPGSAALPLVAAADLLLLVTRAWPDALDAVRARRDTLLGPPEMSGKTRLILAGEVRTPIREIEQVVCLPVAGRVPEDGRGAGVLTGRLRSWWGWTRLDLPRAARSLAVSLCRDSAPAPVSASGGEPRPAPSSARSGTTSGPGAAEARVDPGPGAEGRADAGAASQAGAASRLGGGS